MEDALVATLAAKKAAQYSAINVAMRERINKKTDKITVFLIHEQKERDLFAVDAKEQILAGTATIEPLIEVVGPAGKIKIGEDQWSEYSAKGYKHVIENATADDKAKAELPANEGKSAGDNSNSETIDFGQFDDDQLAVFAKQAGIPGTVRKRETIIAKLTEAGFKPAL